MLGDRAARTAVARRTGEKSVCASAAVAGTTVEDPTSADRRRARPPSSSAPPHRPAVASGTTHLGLCVAPARQPPRGAAPSGFPADWMAAPPAVAIAPGLTRAGSTAHTARGAPFRAFRRRPPALRQEAMAGVPRVAATMSAVGRTLFGFTVRGGRYFIYRPPLGTREPSVRYSTVEI